MDIKLKLEQLVFGLVALFQITVTVLRYIDLLKQFGLADGVVRARNKLRAILNNIVDRKDCIVQL